MKKRFVISLLIAIAGTAGIFAACAGSCAGCAGETTYKLTFDSRGGTQIPEASYAAGQTISRPDDPEKDYYTFDNWYSDKECTKPAFTAEYTFVMPEGDATLYANWLGLTTSRIDFDSDGGTAVDSIVEFSGKPVSEPQAPTKEGYVFGGWTLNGVPFGFDRMPEESITLKAQWNNDSNYAYMTYVINEQTYAVVPVKKGESVTKFEPDLGEGILLTDWFSDSRYNQRYTFGRPAAADTTLYAQSYSDGLQISAGSVTGYTGGSKVIIPKFYEGQQVTSIAKDAFLNNDKVVEVILPDSVKTIGANAFSECNYLFEINLGDVSRIDASAFYSCNRLRNIGSLENVSVVSESVFSGCSDLRSVKFSPRLQSIGDYAFSACSRLTSVDLGSTVTAIGNYAFSNSGITAFNIPASVRTMGECVLDDCKSLSAVTSASSAFAVEDGNLYKVSGETRSLYRYVSKNEEFTLPEGVTSVENGAFSSSAVKTLEFGAGVMLKQGALKGADKLVNLTLSAFPQSGGIAYYFGEAAGGNGTGYVPATLKTVTLTGEVTSLPAYAFYGCTGLEEVEGIDNVVSIGEYAFAYTAIKTITLGANFTSFANDDPAHAFYGDTALTAIIIDDASGCKYKSCDGCLYSSDFKNLVCVPAGKTAIMFAEGVQKIVTDAFAYSSVKIVNVPQTVTQIESGAFRFSAMTELTVSFIGGSAESNNYMPYIFGASVTTSDGEDDLNDNHFISTTLTKITLRNDITAVPDFAFAYITNLKEVETTPGSNITKIGKYAYAATAVEDYNFDGITEIAEGAFISCSSLTEVIIPGSVQTIGDAAFAYCRYISKVELLDGVTAIGEGAFLASRSIYVGTSGSSYRYNSSLREVIIPASVTSIGGSAFAYAGMTYSTALGGVYEVNEDFTLTFDSENIETLGDSAFYHSALKTINLGSKLTSIGARAFEACPQLETVTLGSGEAMLEGTLTIGAMSFADCEKLKAVVIYSDTVPTVNTKIEDDEAEYRNFVRGSYDCLIYVPADSVESYKQAESWSEMKEKVKSVEEYDEA